MSPDRNETVVPPRLKPLTAGSPAVTFPVRSYATETFGRKAVKVSS
jgi:hypothetical protein